MFIQSLPALVRVRIPRQVPQTGFFLMLGCFLIVQAASGYTTYQTTTGSLKLFFGRSDAVMKSATITELDRPLTVPATFQNLSDTALSLKLTFRSIETIEFPQADPLEPDRLIRTVQLGPKETATVEINIVARPGTYSAHYPVHLDVEFEADGTSTKTNLVLVVETSVPAVGTPKNPLLGQMVDDPNRLPLNTLPRRGGLFLPNLDTYRAFWYYDKDTTRNGKAAGNILPVGFSGSHRESGVHISRLSVQRAGIYRRSFSMHPPYIGGVGNAGVEFRIRLPETRPISLSFFSAVRDVVPPEKPSDGVTYRVLVDGERIDEKHHAETVWVAHEVDLSRFAGKEILLRLESDPGPARSTNCDSCSWGDVMLFAGDKPETLSAEEKAKRFEENLAAVQSGRSDSDNTKVFRLDGGLIGAVTFGRNGFVDGVIGLGNAEKQIQFDGLRVWCQGQRIGVWPGSACTGDWTPKGEQGQDAPPRPSQRPSRGKKGRSFQSDNVSRDENQWAQDIEVEGRSGTLFFGLRKNGPALQFSVDASDADLIERIEFGPASATADRVYYGHGYCISKPKRFVAGAGGHNMSTSHVGMDFENGLSLLQATGFPPTRFVVDPETKLYTLSVHPSTTMTLLPGLSGALDCAVRFRSVCDKTAAPGVAEKAGRFVFDIWGGRYKEHVEALEHAVRYGLTDSMFIVHNWQRWGYDNRLPDIWPPNPRWGASPDATPETALDEMRQALKICDEHGIQYGVHDNYIDIYPDAENFGFDETTFHANGQPRKAWLNHGIEAQSYQFRPDRFLPFLERNLDRITPHLPMSTYFVDVFTSASPMDYYDREGRFHSRTKTQAAWNQCFDTIRARLSAANKKFRTATTSSEAGMDSLIGHLDGADCQFLLIDSNPGYYRTRIDCESWSRVPWFDAVHHTTFSLHGVGYGNRYESGRGRLLHGIESDDYLSAEILTGHAQMVDWGSARRGAVRKYWLAQELIRHLADKEIEKVEFSDGNINRQTIRWNDGTLVFVNFEKDDWDISSVHPVNPFFESLPGTPNRKNDSLLLPRYGYYALLPKLKAESGIVKKNGRIIETAGSYGGSIRTTYVNARQKSPGADGLLAVTPTLKSFDYLGENRFKADFDWKNKGAADANIPKDLCVFVHCTEQRMNWYQKLKDGVLGGGFPETPTSQWKPGGQYSFRQTGTVPDTLPEGRYYLVVGLYDQKGDGKRARLIGFDTGSDRYAVAWLKVERKGPSPGEGKLNRISNLSVEPFEWDEGELFERLLPPTEPVDFGICRTKGAFRIEMNEPAKKATVVPLPEEPASEIWLRLPAKARRVKALDAAGNFLRDVPFETAVIALPRPHSTRFSTRPGEFSYEIVW